MDGEVSDSFAIGVGVRWVCDVAVVVLINIFMDGCMREM